MSVTKWEYIHILFYGSGEYGLEYKWEVFNQAGKEGWELVAIQEDGRNKWGIFKRPKSDAK